MAGKYGWPPHEIKSETDSVKRLHEVELPRLTHESEKYGRSPGNHNAKNQRVKIVFFSVVFIQKARERQLYNRSQNPVYCRRNTNRYKRGAPNRLDDKYGKYRLDKAPAA